MSVSAMPFILFLGWIIVVFFHLSVLNKKGGFLFLYIFITLFLYVQMILYSTGILDSTGSDWARFIIYLYLFLALPLIFIVLGMSIIAGIYNRIIKKNDNELEAETIRDGKIRSKTPIRVLSDIDEMLVKAVIDNNIEQVKQLVMQGANPRSTNEDGYSAEDFARARNLRAISDYFRKHT